MSIGDALVPGRGDDVVGWCGSLAELGTQILLSGACCGGTVGGEVRSRTLAPCVCVWLGALVAVLRPCEPARVALVHLPSVETPPPPPPPFPPPPSTSVLVCGASLGVV